MEPENLIQTSQLLTMDDIQLIYTEMINSVCQIEIGNISGTGFFGLIPLDKNKNITVLITAFHIYNKISSYIMKISLNNEKNKYPIILNNSRFKYIDDKNDIVIIEIFPEDNINKTCLEILPYANNKKSFEDLNNKFNNKLVYILQYPNGKECNVSFGMSKIFMDDIRFKIRHTCSTKVGSSGSPIILLENFKVIGIHLKGSKSTFYNNYNEGNILFDSIEMFKTLYIENHTKCITDNIKEEENKELKSFNPFLPKFETYNDSTFSKNK